MTGKDGKEGKDVTEGLYECLVLLNLFPVLLNLSSVYVNSYADIPAVFKSIINSLYLHTVLAEFFILYNSVCRMHHE